MRFVIFSQLSCVKFTDDVIGVQNEDSEIVSGEQEINGRVNGVGRSNWASSTLSSKAGVILVSLVQYDNDYLRFFKH